MKETLDILSGFKDRGIVLSLDGSGRNVKARGNVRDLSAEDKVLLMERKDDIVLLLRQAGQTMVSIEPLSKQNSYALSSSQRRLWLLSQFEEAAAVYNIPLSFILEGEVNEQFFHQAFHTLITRHESLRTIFTEDNEGEPRQVILEPEHSGFALSCIDLRSSSGEKEVTERIARYNAEAFDLRTGPLMRAALVRVEEQECVLHCVLHHIISDGWSMHILVEELFRLYDAYSSGMENPLPPLRIQYKDYAAWQQEQLSGEQLGGDKAYWLQQLAGELPVLELPVDRARPKIKTYNGALVERQLPLEMRNALAALSQQQGGTLFMGLLATVKALFYHYSGQTDIITGTPIAGREHAELEGQIGFFLNTLALRTRFNPEASFRELLDGVKKVTLDAFAHQGYPFEELVEDLHLQRDRSRNPLFDVLVVLQNTGLHTAAQQRKAGGLKVSVHQGADVQASKFDLTIAFVEAADGLQLSIEYNTDIYDRSTIERMAVHLERLMSAAVATPEAAISQLDYLSREEKHQLLVQFNDTDADYPKNKTLVQLLEEQAARTPGATAVLFEHRELTYKELNEQANQLAHCLSESYSLQPEDIIGVKLERSEKLIIALLAVLKSGAAYVPIDPEYPQERIDYMISDSSCKLVIDEVLLQSFLREEDRYSRENLTPYGLTPSCLAYLIYTSGSTGQPKGVMIEHRNVAAFLSWCSDEFRNSDFDTVFATTSVCFDLSVFEIFYTLTAGKKLRILPNGLAIPQYLHTGNRILVNTVPSVVGTLLSEGMDFSNITVLNMAGEPVPPGYIRQLDCGRMEVRNLYGPSEDTTYSTVFRIKGDKPVLIGRPISNTQVYITGSGGQLVPVGATGEICISGAGLARGYLGKRELTAEKFILQSFNGKKERIYRTGDLGRWTADGNIEFLGRKDNQVKVRGYRIELGEIESVLQSTEGIEAAVVLAKTTPAGEKELVAYIVSSNAVQVQELRSSLGKALPAYMIPTYFIQLDELPLTPNGKVDRKRLPGPDGLGLSPAVEYIAPRNQTEEKLALIWQDILSKEKVSVKDDFFDLGGHSLKASRLVSRIHREFEVKVELRQLFSHTTIEEQAKLVAQSQEAYFNFIAPVAEQPDYAASSSQHSLWMMSQFEEGSIAYNIPSAYVFKGALDRDALSRSLQALLARHESLGTVFRQDSEGRLRQVIRSAEDNAFDLLFHDLRNQPERKQAVKDLVQQEFFRPFDLVNGPLLRASLYQLEDNEWVFSYVLHHIVTDGWSMEIFIKELMLLYNARLHGAENPLKPLRIQYKDYAAWQQQELGGDLQNIHKSYWLRQFEGELPVLHLPLDCPRPLVKTYNGGMVIRDIPAAITEPLNAFGEQQGATLFMGLIAAINTLLYRYTNQHDIIIGSPVAGRPHVDLEDQMGNYVNMLTLRSRFSGEQSYGELLAQVRQLTLEAYEHQLYPFDELANALVLQRDASRHPLFDVTVTLQNMAQLTAPHSLPGAISITPYNAGEHVTSKFDLNFNFAEQGSGLRLRVEYNSDLFDRSTAERIAAHLEQLLQAVIIAPATPLNQIDFLSSSEKQLLLHDFNDTAVAWPSGKTINTLFEEQVERTPDATALVFEDKTFTYRQLNEIANQLAHYLKTYYTITPDDLVAIQLDRSEWMMIAILAVLKSGAAYMPIDADYPSRRIGHMLEDSGSKVLIESMLIDHFCMEQDQYSKENPSTSSLLPSHLAYVMYTSGSTGKPKGVLVEHRSVVRLVCPCSFAPLTGNEVLLATGAFSFDATTFEYWSMLLHGGTLVLCPKEVLLDSRKLRQEIEERKVDMMWFTAGWLHQLVDEDPSVFAGLKTVLAGGDKLSVTHINRLHQCYPELRIINGYGPTENTTFSLTCEIPPGAESIPIGKPIANSTAYVLDAQGQLCPVGVAGELCVGGAGLARGYLNNPELTGEKFIAHPFIQGERLYRTGDMARWVPDGNIEFLGRKDDQVKIRGYRIEIGEIEEVLQSYPGIDAAVVQARSVDGGEKLLVAYVVGSEALRREELRSYLSKRLPSYMIPSHYVQLEALPLNSNGKIDRDALPDLQGLELNAGVEYIAPRNRTEEKLVQLWQEILCRENISVKDNFFDLGGHSLKITRLISQVHKEFDVKIELKDMFEVTVLEDQARLIDQSARTSFITIDSAEEQVDYPLSSSQRRLWILSQLGEASAAYNMPAVLLLEGNLDKEALQASFASLIERHESLRTIFRENEEGEARQVIQSPAASGFVLNYFDLRSDEDRLVMKDSIQKDFNQPFDLSAGPLLRASLYRVEDSKWVFTYVMHHIISDGWSMQVLVRELLQFYNARTTGREAAPAPLRIQHRHYTAWQQERLNGVALKIQRDYWLKQFEGTLPMLDLPTDKPRPQQRTYSGGVVTRTISRDITQQLKALCQEQNGTLFMGLLATANALLYRYTGQHDIVIGSPIAGRDHADLENQIGFYLNTLPLRTRFSGKDSYRQLLDNTRPITLDAYQNQAFPFDELVDALDLRPEPGRNMLFDVALVLQNTQLGGAAEELQELTIKPYEEETSRSAKFDLSFSFVETENGLEMYLEYNSDIYEAATAERLAGHFRQLVQSAVEQPSVPIDRLDYLTPAEKDLLFGTFNNTVNDYPKDQTIISLFEEQVARGANNIALSWNGGTLTYGELNEKAARLAHHLRKGMGVEHGTLVGIMLQRSELMVISILAVLKSGGAYVPIDPNLPADRKEYILQDTGIKTLVTQTGDILSGVDSFKGNLLATDIEQLESFGKEREQCSSESPPPFTLQPSHLAYVIYTSGSTGRPKGVLLQHGGVVNLALWQREQFGIGAGSRILQQFSYSFDGAVGETVMALLNGGTLCMYPGSPLAEDLAAFVDEQAISIGVFVPSQLRQIDPGSIRHIRDMTVVSVGEACPVDLAAEWGAKCRFMNAYGPTEYSVYSHLEEVHPGSLEGAHIVPIGKPIFNTHTFILDGARRPAGIGVQGEIYLSGDGMARGYLDNNTATMARFVPNPFFLEDKYSDKGWTELPGSREDIEDLERRGHILTHLPDVKQENCMKDLLELADRLEPSLRKQALAEIERNRHNEAKLNCLHRYFLEAYYNSYASQGINEPVLRMLFGYDDFGGKEGVELGFGNAEVLSALDGMGASVRGVELCPFFVQKARNKGLDAWLGEVDLPYNEFLEACGLEDASLDFSICTLLLDRVEQPRNLVRNLLRVLKEDGRFALQTLLPVVPVDDGDVEEKIIYTSEANRLTPGAEADEDKLVLIQVLYELGAADMCVYQLPYAVVSRDGVQEYKIWSFTGRRRAVEKRAESYSRMYRTGDLGKYLPNGSIAFLGRTDHQIKLRGYRIELGEIESVLQSHPAVDAAAVITRTNNGDTELLAYFTSARKLNIPELSAYLSDLLPHYMRPARLLQIDEMPLTSGGKVDRNRLPAPAEDAGTGTTYIAPRNSTEEMLAAAWKEILGRDRVGVKDNFFELGGHSLRATRLASQVRKHLNVQVPLAELFARPVLEDMALWIRQAARSEDLRILPVAEQPSYPLSSAQRRLWVLSRFEEANAAYNMPGVYIFEGELDTNAFEMAFQLLIDRHEALRTVFRKDEEDSIRQFIRSTRACGFTLEQHDFRSSEDREQRIKELVAGEITKPFDISAGPLLRASLYRAEHDKWVFAYVMHHIISDGWSMSILVSELLTLYNAYAKGEEYPLPQLHIQYKDYASWQQEQLKEGAFNIHRQYWLDQFAELPPVLELPTDKLRPAVKTYNGNVLHRTIPAEINRGLQALLQEQGATLFMGLMAVVNTLLHRYSNQEDIVLGTPIAGRNQYELEDQIGFYLNTLPLRTRFNSNDSYRELLAQVKKVTLDAYEHQSYPFDELVDALPLQRSMSRSPLFDVMLVLQNNEQSATMTADRLSISAYPDMENPVSKFDLVFNFVELGDDLHASIEYNTDLYEQATVQRMAAHLQQLMAAVIEHPTEPIARLDYLGEEEKRQLLVSFNDIPKLQPRSPFVTDMFEEQVRKQPGALAVIASGTRMSYEEVNDKVNRMAHYLRNVFGAKPGDLVGIKVDRTEWMVISILGVLKSGAAYVPIDPEYPQERIDYMIADSSCRVLVDDQWLDTFRDKMHLYDNANPSPLNLTPSDLAYVIYTSGSTGNPKGVAVPHSNLGYFFACVEDMYKGVENIVQPFLASHSFDISILQLFAPLFLGGVVVVVTKEQMQDPGRLVEVIKECTVIDSVPSLLQMVISYTEKHGLTGGFGHVKEVFVGGELLPDALLRQLGKAFPNSNITNSYGPTEATIFCLQQLYRPGSIGMEARGTIIGPPINGSQAYILNDAGLPMPVGMTGEICIGGFGVAQGYLNRPELTAHKFVLTDPVIARFNNGIRERIYRTGDLGRWLPDGTIEFMGRKDDQVKIRGFRVELGEIENTICNHPDIGSVAVSAVTGKQGEKELVAYLTGPIALNATDIRAYLKNILPAHMIPGYFVQLVSLPLTPNGKVDRKRLPAPDGLVMTTGNAYMAPRNSMEEKLVPIWEEVLRRDKIGVKDNFFDLGGNSLKIIRMVDSVNKAFGKNLSVVMGFKYPNIAELAEFLLLEQHGGSGGSDEDMETDVSTVDETLHILNQQ